MTYPAAILLMTSCGNFLIILLYPPIKESQHLYPRNTYADISQDDLYTIEEKVLMKI